MDTLHRKISEAKNEIGKLVGRSRAGHMVVLTSYGRPVAVLMAVSEDEHGNLSTHHDLVADGDPIRVLRRTPREITS